MKKTITTIGLAIASLLLCTNAKAQETAESNMPEFIANLVYETDLVNSFDVLKGIYKFQPAETIQLDTVYVSTMMNANGGGVFRRDLFQFINYMDFGYGMPAQCAIYECYFDADGNVHWDRPELRYGATVPEEMAAVNGMLVEDPASGELYGIYEANYGYSSMLARADIDNLTREDIGELNEYYLCIACNYTGRLFGINEDGIVFEINKQTGEETEIFDTGLWPENVDQSMCFDPATGHLWWATTEDGTSKLYELDLDANELTLRGTFPWQERFFALSIAQKPTSQAAPGAVADLEAYFNEGSTSGTLSFTLPNTSVAGEQLTGDLTYYVYANGENVAEKTAAAGSHVEEELTLPSGNTRFRVYAENAAGQGEDATLTLWIGFDIPAKPENVVFDIDENGNAVVTWDAVATSLNDGYFDADNLKYKVVRYFNGEETEYETAANSFETLISEGADRHPCHFGVTAVNGDKAGDETLSNNAATGNVLSVPFEDNFEDADMASLYTILNANNDENTWEWTGSQYGTFIYKYNKYNAADDWFVTPLIQLEAGVEYGFMFDARPQGKEYPEKISAFYGKGMDMSAYTMLMDETSIAQDSIFILPFTPAVSGAYRMAIHAVSPANQLNLILDYVGVDKYDVLGISDKQAEEQNVVGQYFTIDGRRIGNINGKKGLYLVRRDSKTMKVIKQ